MADRYWVGGTDSWDGTAGTKWSSTSGGAGGASVPTSVDDVFLNASSGGTITIATGNTGAKSINCTGFTGALQGSASLLVAGSITLAAGMTCTYTGTITFTATATIITAGKSLSSFTVNTAGITVTLGDAFIGASGTTIVVLQGTFDTAGYNVTVSNLRSDSSVTRTVTLGASTVTLSSSLALQFTATNFTFNAGTSTINLIDANAQLQGGGRTFYNVSFASALAGGSASIVGSNTFNNLTINASVNEARRLDINGNQTVNGTFTCAGSSAISRGFVFSDNIGSTRTITAAAIAANDCDFRDITIAGAASPISPTRAGNCGGNSGINFPAAKTVYRVGTSTSWSGSSSWALISGGTGSNDNFPLAQDTVVIDQNTALTGTLALGVYYNIGTLDCSTRTTGITLNNNAITTRYGSCLFGSGVTISGSSTQTFSGRGIMSFTSAGKTISFPITVDGPGGTFRLEDAFNSSNNLRFTQSTFNANNYNLTCSDFNSVGSLTRTVTMGSGLWTFTGTGSVWSIGTTGMTLNKNTANILLSSTTTIAREFNGGNLSYNKLTIGGSTGTSTISILNTNSFTELASTKTVAHTITFRANQGTIGAWTVTGTPGNIVTVNSDVPGTRRTFTLTNITTAINYLNITDIGELSNNKFYVTNSIDGGNNSNVYFSASPGLGGGNMLMLFV